MNITDALATMTVLDVRRRGDSLRCPHPLPPRGEPRHTVILWDRSDRLPVTGHPVYAPGFLCSACHAEYRRRLG